MLKSSINSLHYGMLSGPFSIKIIFFFFLYPFTPSVINDIISTMFNKGFMEELLMPQEVYYHRALRTVLTRLAHASIMRLNPASMDRVRSSL